MIGKKIFRDCTDNKNYLIHYRMLKLYTRHGTTIDKVHEIISFTQSRWLEKYISFITQKRNKSKNKLEKDFFKLIIKGFFLQNVRKYS